MTTPFEDRAIGSLLGLAVGDALGTTLEFATRDSRPPVTEMVGGGPFSLEPGQWTDDTSMALCLADSLIACGELIGEDVMARFLAWYRNGENSCIGKCFDIGLTTRSALESFDKRGKSPTRGDPQAAGNGSLMRLAPIAIFFAPDSDVASTNAEEQSYLTHSAHEAAITCGYFAGMLIKAFHSGSKNDVFAKMISLEALGRRRREEVRSTGYVRDTFQAALWAVWTTSSFEEAVILAANLGDDADTVAAVTGQLAGAIYGASAIPERWLTKLAWRDHIEERAMALLANSQGAE